MALKVLMLRKKLNDKQKALDALRAKADEFATREAELEKSIEEASTDEERSVVEEAINQFETEKENHTEAVGNLEREVQELEDEIKAEEEKQNTEPGPAPEPANEREKEITNMNTRTKFFGMTVQERDAFIAREDVKNFLADVRSAMEQKRALTNVGYLIPDVMLGLLRENVENYSKLYKHVDVRRVGGTSRMVIEGTIPEAVWTEMCANLNELDLAFDRITLDGWKCGGFFRICNATLRDSDIDLASELLRVLGEAIGLALDKAILYGTGTKMPQGIVKALSLVENTPNIFSIAASVTGVALFQNILTDYSAASDKYSRGNVVWAMNEATYTKLRVQAMSINAAGAIVSGMERTMPVIGGTVETLNFIPDNVIIAGYGDMYLLAEREGVELSTSEHAFWVADQTGFKGTARYDGKVKDADAFVAIGINGVTPTAAMTFAADTANS
jgi:HK97 family phage major capsid protein